MTPPVPFTLEEAEQLYDECRFNCGPSALCAVTAKRPADVLEDHGRHFSGHLIRWL